MSAASRRPDGSVRLMIGGLYEVRCARAWCADAVCGMQVKKARDVCGSVARACLVLLNAAVWLVVAVGAPLGRCQRACHHHPLQSQLSRFSCEASARVWTILSKIDPFCCARNGFRFRALTGVVPGHPSTWGTARKFPGGPLLTPLAAKTQPFRL